MTVDLMLNNANCSGSLKVQDLRNEKEVSAGSKEFYLARDVDGGVTIFNHKPVLYEGKIYCCDEKITDADYSLLFCDWFPEVTFENSPVKVKITIVKE